MMTSWQSSDIEVHGLRLHYTRTGGARPPLVLAHGVGDDGLCWTTVAEAFAPEYDVIMVDARGHGRSSAPEQDYGPAAQAEDLAGVIAELGLHRPIILGHSMGAMTTLALAGTYPAVPEAILLEDPPAVWMPRAGDAQEEMVTRAQRGAAMASLKRKTCAELVADQRAVAPHWSDAEIERWADSKQRFSPNVLEIFHAPVAAGVDWAAILPRITCPALLITADPEQGAIVTAESAAALHSLIPQLRIAHIPAAGHSMRHDQLAAYLAVVGAFLKELPVAPAQG
jgi:N-formylmaleamate deformylase